MSESGQNLEAHELYRLCSHTRLELEAFSRAVSEGKQLDAAVAFCRYLKNSGVLKLLKLNPQSHPLPVDGYLLEHAANELERAVTRRYATGDSEPHVELCELERISRKLDLIAAQVAKFSPVKVDTTAPPLRIIEGGLHGE